LAWLSSASQNPRLARPGSQTTPAQGGSAPARAGSRSHRNTTLKFIFGQFPAPWLTYFENAHVPVISYDFLDGRLVTLVGRLHFTEQGLFITDREVRTEDLLCTQPELFAFVPTPRIPTNPLIYLTPPEQDKPL